MKKLCCLALFFSICGLSIAQDAITAIDKLKIEHLVRVKQLVDSKVDTTAKENKLYTKFLDSFKEQEQSELKINGELGFGLVVSNSQNQDLSQFAISAKVSRGFFPAEFGFSSSINVSVQDGKFIENLSDTFLPSFMKNNER